jgi:hypothetical protein
MRLQLQQGNAAGALRTADTQLRRELGAKDPVHFRRTLMHAHARCVEALEAAKTVTGTGTATGTGATTKATALAASVSSAPVQLTAAQAVHVRAMRDLALELVEHKCVARCPPACTVAASKTSRLDGCRVAFVVGLVFDCHS